VLRCRLKGPAMRSVACLRMTTSDDGQASYKEPWACATPLNKFIDTMSGVYVESTEPKQVYDVKLDFVSERTIKDHHHPGQAHWLRTEVRHNADVVCDC
jgi:hypothetical protein